MRTCYCSVLTNPLILSQHPNHQGPCPQACPQACRFFCGGEYSIHLWQRGYSCGEGRAESWEW